jgi:hypothetical protein
MSDVEMEIYEYLEEYLEDNLVETRSMKKTHKKANLVETCSKKKTHVFLFDEAQVLLEKYYQFEAFLFRD